MARKSTTLRWDETAHRIVRDEARHAGITVAQFVREAALIRAAIRAAERDAPGTTRNWRVLAAEIERLARFDNSH